MSDLDKALNIASECGEDFLRDDGPITQGDALTVLAAEVRVITDRYNSCKAELAELKSSPMLKGLCQMKAAPPPPPHPGRRRKARKCADCGHVLSDHDQDSGECFWQYNCGCHKFKPSPSSGEKED